MARFVPVNGGILVRDADSLVSPVQSGLGVLGTGGDLILRLRLDQLLPRQGWELRAGDGRLVGFRDDIDLRQVFEHQFAVRLSIVERRLALVLFLKHVLAERAEDLADTAGDFGAAVHGCTGIPSVLVGCFAILAVLPKDVLDRITKVASDILTVSKTLGNLVRNILALAYTRLCGCH
jgi:hypothetical protein